VARLENGEKLMPCFSSDFKNVSLNYSWLPIDFGLQAG
jgi:hypothetical protein